MRCGATVSANGGIRLRTLLPKLDSSARLQPLGPVLSPPALRPPALRPRHRLSHVPSAKETPRPVLIVRLATKP